MWGGICIVIGVLCFPFAALSYIWVEPYYVIGFNRPAGYIAPYRGYAIPLMLLGVVLFSVGLVLWGHERKEEDQSQQEKRYLLRDVTEEQE